jgi:multidrug efflux pump subunit AcrB
MLMGIVTKNAIMLVDFALTSIREGMKREDAIVDAGIKRARPIVMTTVAMVAGMLPSALAYGIGGEFRSPMALAVIGGLIFSTLLSLVFVPAAFMTFSYIGDKTSALKNWIGSLFTRKKPIKEEVDVLSPGAPTST